MERVRQTEKFKDRKRGSRIRLRVSAVLCSVQTCSSIAPGVAVREERIHHLIHRSGVHKARKIDKVV